jgi:hypothetical protein
MNDIFTTACWQNISCDNAMNIKQTGLLFIVAPSVMVCEVIDLLNLC